MLHSYALDMTAVVAPASVRVIVTFCFMTIILSPRDVAKLTFRCISLKQIGGRVDHDAAHRRSNLRYCSSVIVRFTARTPLQRSRGHPIVVQVGLGSFAVDGHIGNSTFSAGGRSREPAAEYVFHSLQVWAPKLGAQRHSMKLGIRILLHRLRLQQELRALYRADSVLP